MSNAAVPARPACRPPRFRQPETPLPLTANTRDLDILAALAELRFLTGPDICRLILPDAAPCPGCRGTGLAVETAGQPASHHRYCVGTGRLGAKAVLERLNLLFRAHLVDRPPQQLVHYRPKGSERVVYALSSAGARLLADVGRIPPQRLDHLSRKNSGARKLFIDHTLRIARFAIAVRLAARLHPDITLIDGEALVDTLPEPAQRARFPFKLISTLTRRGSDEPLSAIPDTVFALSFDDGHGAAARAYAVEIDTGHEPITRADLAQTSVLRKLVTYHDAVRAGRHRQRLGWEALRVAILTSTPTRRDSILAAIANHKVLKSSRLFLVACDDDVHQHAGDILLLPWLTHNGKPHQMLPTVKLK